MDLVGRLVPKLLPHEKERVLRKGIAQAAAWGLTTVHQAGIDEEELELLAKALRGRPAAARLRGPRHGARPDPGGARPPGGAAPPLRLGPAARGGGEGLRGRRRGGEDGGDVRALRRGAAPGSRTGRRRSSTARWPPTTRPAGRSCSTRSATGGSTWPSPPSSAPRARTARPAAVTGSSTSRWRARPTCRASRRRGIVASTQALFPYPNQNHLGVYVPTLGPERARRAMAFKAIDDAGAVQAFGSDWPVFTAEVVRGIACAVTRTTVEGTPAGGLGAVAAAHRRGGAAALHPRRGLRRARREGEGHARARQARRLRRPLAGPPRRSRRSGSRTRRCS